jgi:cysteine desulfurase
VSAGAACSSGKVGASHVLAAMGLEPRIARAAIRISLGWTSTQRDVAAFLEAWSQVALARRERAVA